ncbi:MAG TPA: discoidin domain-containing protein [Myxococcaceae bacterium]
MRSLPPLASLLLAASAPSALAAPPSVGYAQAADYLDKDSHPERYHPLNVLDGRDTTVWCGPQGEGPSRLTIGFKGVASVDEVRLYTGNGSARDAFKEYARAKKLTLEGKDSARNFTVEDKRGMQTVPLNPPVSGGWFTLEVKSTFPGSEPSAPVCLTDVVFYSEGKPLNGTKLAPVLKYEARTAPLLGTWFAGHEGAPDRFLSLYVDGTYRFVHEPLDGAEPTVLTGAYTASASKLTVELPKKGKVALKYTRQEADGPSGGHTLTLEGDLPDEWKEPFRSRP